MTYFNEKLPKEFCSEVGCWLGKLPIGCVLCLKGLKSVVFITGLCSEKCYYCPISKERKGKDVVLINELTINSLEDVINEIKVCDSLGAGITGGDPLIRINRTVEFIRLLKSNFGQHFHIHLYTTGLLLSDELMNKLVNAGLDELRIHVTGEHSWRALKIALQYPLDVGIENPAIPNAEHELKKLIINAVSLGVKFINLNELEVSETNINELLIRGIEPNEDGLTAKGSEELALKILRWVKDNGLDINIHYCPARFKDRFQLRYRLVRRAVNTMLPFEELDEEEGIIRWVEIIECPNDVLIRLIRKGMIVRKGNKLLTKPSIPELKFCRYKLIEAYPLSPRKIINMYLSE